MKIIRKYLCTVFLSVLLVVVLAVNAYAASDTMILDWWLIDSGGHLDWGGSTKYNSSFVSACNAWNGSRSGVIRKDTAFILEDITISDYSAVDNIAGGTNQLGSMRFNTYYMDGFSLQKRQHVCMHELGHALGIAHLNHDTDIMYPYVTSVTTLSQEDETAYHVSWTRIFGIPGCC